MINKSFKKYLISGTLLLPIAYLSSCDNVEPADRYEEMPSKEIARKVLVQEFTGIQCVNCPTGAMTISELQKQAPGSIIAVGLHPSGTAFSGPIGNFDLNTPEADVYYATYKPIGFPAIVVNGVGPEINMAAWDGMIDAALGMPAPAEISLKGNYDEATRELEVNYDVIFNAGYQAKLNMNIWICENGILGPQKSGSTFLPKYVHNHVMRASLTGDWGISLGEGFHLEDVRKGSVSYTIPEEYVAENCVVVAFLQNNDKKVEQCEEIHVIPMEEENP